MPRSRHLVTGTILVLCGLAPAGCGGGSDKDKSADAKQDQPAASAQDVARQDAEAKSSARTLVTGVETCFADSQSYDSCKTAEQLAAIGEMPGVSLGSGPGQTEVSAAGAATFTITSRSRSGNAFTITKAEDGKLTRSCTAQAQGGCNGGTW